MVMVVMTMVVELITTVFAELHDAVQALCPLVLFVLTMEWMDSKVSRAVCLCVHLFLEDLGLA